MTDQDLIDGLGALLGKFAAGDERDRAAGVISGFGLGFLAHRCGAPENAAGKAFEVALASIAKAGAS